MPSSLRTAITAVAMQAITTASGPAMMSHGQGSLYQLLTGDDERGLFMAHHLVVADGLHDEFDRMRLRLGERSRVVGGGRAKAYGQHARLRGPEVDRLVDAHDLETGEAVRADAEAARGLVGVHDLHAIHVLDDARRCLAGKR